MTQCAVWKRDCPGRANAEARAAIGIFQSADSESVRGRREHERAIVIFWPCIGGIAPIRARNSSRKPPWQLHSQQVRSRLSPSRNSSKCPRRVSTSPRHASAAERAEGGQPKTWKMENAAKDVSGALSATPTAVPAPTASPSTRQGLPLPSNPRNPRPGFVPDSRSWPRPHPSGRRHATSEPPYFRVLTISSSIWHATCFFSRT